VRGAELHLPAGTWDEITPGRAGWTYCGLRVLRLGELVLETDDREYAVVPLAGSLSVEIDGRRFELAGRESVFSRVTDWAYVPIGTRVRLAGDAEVALASAGAEHRFEPAHVTAEAVPVEVRGAGASTRQIVNFMSPEAFPGADRLICVEVLTPDGNWSSYPPHKHDDTPDSLANNEEIYYFRLGKAGDPGTSAEGFALHRTYTADGAIDATVVVRDRDVFLVPRGYHGPSIAAPGYPLYYLNVMAGDNEQRTMAIVDDPQYAWVRSSWETMQADPRVPLITA
jgi:5-deoxy-glucuronate isomerase